MSTRVLSNPAAAISTQAASRSTSALHSLMQLWEQESVIEDDESETELMVMLSGMVGSYATALGAE